MSMIAQQCEINTLKYICISVRDLIILALLCHILYSLLLIITRLTTEKISVFRDIYTYVK